MKTASIVALIIFLMVSDVMSNMYEVEGRGRGRGHGGACGRTPLRRAALSLSPCLGAARNGRARVTPICCGRVGALIRTAPRCLCAVLLSPLARQAGINPGVAISIPKRCNIRNRPAGKRCGSKSLHLFSPTN